MDNNTYRYTFEITTTKHGKLHKQETYKCDFTRSMIEHLEGDLTQWFPVNQTVTITRVA